MKTPLYSFLFFVAIGSFSGCFVTSKAHSFYKAPGFKPDATFKIINVNSGDILLGRMENYLLKEGFNLVSDNYIRGAIPAGRTIVSSRDTTYQVPNSEMMAVRFTDDKPSDYVIKYQYETIFGDRINFLNINVVNTQTGKTEVSFSYPERSGNGRTVIRSDDAFALFVAGLRK
ncbi:MAG: hypothetical protein SH848_00230 [Saprospiraceae bacterium]|nr:hypothetical protein [Saprospiraceae bacterium]MDZ4702322.1 hypothetical protein [Saprospiraceae bacterium]